MSNQNINKTLAELQRSLSSIESAKSQVESVTRGSEKLTNSTNDLVKGVNQMANVIKTETDNVIKNFSKSIDSYKGQLDGANYRKDKIITHQLEQLNKVQSQIQDFSSATLKGIELLSKESISKQDAELSKLIASVNNRFEKKMTNISSNIDVAIKEGRIAIEEENDKFNFSVHKITTDTEKLINNLTKSSVNIIEKQKVEVDKLITNVSQYTKEINDIFEELRAGNLLTRVEKIGDSIIKTNEEFHNLSIRQKESEGNIIEAQSSNSKAINANLLKVYNAVKSINELASTINKKEDNYIALQGAITKLEEQLFDNQTSTIKVVNNNLRKVYDAVRGFDKVEASIKEQNINQLNQINIITEKISNIDNSIQLTKKQSKSNRNLLILIIVILASGLGIYGFIKYKYFLNYIL